MENGRHRVVKHFRFTETEAAKLRKLAKEFNMTESEYIRLLLNNKPSDYPEIRIMLSNLINEVNHVGNNINQIARKLHTDGEVPNDSTLYFLNKNILKYRKESEKIWLLIRRLISGQIHMEQ